MSFGTGGVSSIGFDYGHGGDNSDTPRTFMPTINDRLLLSGTYTTRPRFNTGSFSYVPNDLGIVRLLTDGTRDGSFGSNGKVMLGVVPPSSFGDFGDIISLDDGSVFYAGSYVTPRSDDTYSSGLLLGRLNVDGTPDPAFHLDRAFTPGAFLPGAQIVYVRRVKRQADGKIVILVAADLPSPSSICAGVMRLMPDGSTDTTFGHGKAACPVTHRR